jgi:hypothetical protein
MKVIIKDKRVFFDYFSSTIFTHRLLNAAGCYTDANIHALTSVMNLESVEVSLGPAQRGKPKLLKCRR